MYLWCVFWLLSVSFVSWYCWSVGFFFFFKQKTAYEMRISDWSSDVCSSDLSRAGSVRGRYRRRLRMLGQPALEAWPDHRTLQPFEPIRRLANSRSGIV